MLTFITGFIIGGIAVTVVNILLTILTSFNFKHVKFKALNTVERELTKTNNFKQ